MSERSKQVIRTKILLLVIELILVSGTLFLIKWVQPDFSLWSGNNGQTSDDLGNSSGSRIAASLSDAEMQVDDSEEAQGKDSAGDDSKAAADDADADGNGTASEVAAGEIDFEPHAVSSTEPTNYLISTEVSVDGEMLADKSEYAGKSLGEITFTEGEDYSDQEGVFTFRGNNFRDDPTYGVSSYTWGSMTSLWSVTTGSLTFEDAVWSGSGWTGQPLMRRWSSETKKHMNMYEWAKADSTLVEVIYACMDGYVYFLDMVTGERTRDPLWLGYTFKGAGALDPRGYPVLYLGAGYDNNESSSRAFVINLLDCSIMYEFGNDDPFALRGGLSYFDSSPLVDAETDTLIYPGENGILYLIHLGSSYDESTGKFSMSFDKVVKWRYSSNRTSHEMYWPGMETSCAIYKNYLYVADNGANLMCIDLNTLKTVWVQDTLDDTNSSPVLSIEDGKVYLYISTSFHLGWRSTGTATVPIWKIDAETGEIVWQTDYECSSLEGVSGGTQSTIAVGKNDLADYIYVTIGMTHGTGAGDIACLKKSDGSKKWENQIPYTWSSPVCVYNESGEGEVIYGASDGYLRCLNGLTGEEKSHLQISSGTIEASPAVFEDYLVVGTRSGKICGIKLE